MKISYKNQYVKWSSLVTEGHIQVEQGLAEFSDSVPSAHSCFTLAGWGLSAGRMHVWNGTGAALNSQCLRCWRSRMWVRPQPPPQLLTHQHLLGAAAVQHVRRTKILRGSLG